MAAKRELVHSSRLSKLSNLSFRLCEIPIDVKAENMNKPPDSRRFPKTVLRQLKLVLVGVATAIVVAVGISQWQDWSVRLQERNALRELESHALGPDNLPSPESFYPIRVVATPPVVSRFDRLSMAEAEGKVDDSELVLAVRIGDQARAYPINMLNGPTREIINDELGGRSIAATW